MLFDTLVQLTGGVVPVDHLKLITCLLAAYPLALVYNKLPNADSKHVYGILVSAVILNGVFSLYNGYAQLWFSALGTYGICKYGRGWGKSMPWLVFTFVMGHMTLAHIHRQIERVGLETIEITGTQMVLCMKLTAFAWNVYDGTLPEQKISHQQKITRMTQMPSLLSFLGFVFYFPGILVGPSCEFADYLAFTDMSMFAIVDAKHKEKMNGHVKRQKKYKVPNAKRTATLRMLQGLFFLGVYSMLGSKYAYHNLLEASFLRRPFLIRMGYLNLAGFVARTKYYGVWSIAEGSCILSGLGFNGYDSKDRPLWNRCQNIDLVAIETAQSLKEVLDAWNKNTNKWLRNYVYLRVTPEGRKPGFSSSMITFGTSALWHGLYPGYMLTFLSGGFAQATGRVVRRNIRPFFLTPDLSKSLPSKVFYDLLGIILTQNLLNYIVLPFLILDFRPSLVGWSRVYWSGHVCIFAIIIWARLGGARYCQNQLRRRAQKAGIAPSVSHQKTAKYLDKEKGKAGSEVPMIGVEAGSGLEKSRAAEKIDESVQGS